MSDPIVPPSSGLTGTILDILKGVSTASGPEAIERAVLALGEGVLLIGISMSRAVDIAEKKWGGVKEVAKEQSGEIPPTV